MTESEAALFADRWVSAWNSHDLEAILSHYSDDVELTSPLVTSILSEGQSLVSGKANLRDYFRRGLEAYPDLRFTLRAAYPGARSVVVLYGSIRGLRAAELMELDAEGRVARVVAHYLGTGDPAP
jgi:SnoaL-like protein